MAPRRKILRQHVHIHIISCKATFHNESFMSSNLHLSFFLLSSVSTSICLFFSFPLCLSFFLSRLPTFSLPLSVQLLRLSVRPSACLSVFLCLLLHSLLVNYTCKYKLSSLLVQLSKPVKKDLGYMQYLNLQQVTKINA